MPRLVHLNGPPGIGKSTIAQMYVDHHPGVLNLDIDQVRFLIGGWRADFAGSGELARPLALSMAETHLGAGYDVILPQYLGRLEEIEKFEAIARACVAAFVEVVLMDTREQALERFVRRTAAAEQLWHRVAGEVVDGSGGVLLEDMYDRLADVIRVRRHALVVHSDEGQPAATYRAVLAVLASA